MKKKISVVIPTYNEEANVVPLRSCSSTITPETTPRLCCGGSVERTKGSRRSLTQGTSGRPVRRFME